MVGKRSHNEHQVEYFSAERTPLKAPGGSSRQMSRELDEVLELAGVDRNSSILEVGCGSGIYTRKLLERGYRVEGLDLTPQLLEELRGRLAADSLAEVSLYCADLSGPPSELEGKYDAVIGFHVLHHVHDVASCLAGAAKMTRPGGRVVFVEPNAYNPLFYVQITTLPRLSWREERGIVKMRASFLFDCMRRAGLRELEERRFGFFPPQISNRRWGERLQRRIEKIQSLRPILPFLVVKGVRR